jgi:hypothetical protein
LRIIGTAIGLTGLLNFALSMLSMKLGSIAGIAFATVAAQIVLSLAASRFVCRQLGIDALAWMLRTCALPAGVTAIAGAARIVLPTGSVSGGLLFAALLMILSAFVAWATGITPKFVQEELRTLRSMFQR